MSPDEFLSRYSKPLFLFRQVYEYGSFIAAAVPSGVSDSHLSNTMTHLENSLGTTLFNRSRRTGCTPTEAAKKLYELVISFESSFENVFPSKFDHRSTKFSIAFAGNSYFRSVFWPALVSNLYCQCPAGEFKLSAADKIEGSDESEIVFTSYPLGGSYQSTIIYQDSVLLVSNKTMRDHHGIVLGPDAGVNEILLRHLGVDQGAISVGCYYSLIDTVASAAVVSAAPKLVMDKVTRLNTFPISASPLEGSYSLYMNVRANVAEHPKLKPVVAQIHKLKRSMTWLSDY